MAQLPIFHSQKLIDFRLALQWTGAYQHRLSFTHRAHTDEVIARFIYECTGEFRNRKQVASHIQNLKKLSSSMPEAADRLKQQIDRATAELREADMDDTAQIDEIIRPIQNAVSMLARRNQEIEFAAFARSQRRRRQSRRKTQPPAKPPIRKDVLEDPPPSLFHELSQIASQNDHKLLLQPLRPLGSNFLALSLVNKLFRTEVLQYIESHLSFDFTGDAFALPSFCELVSPVHRQRVRHLAIEFVDGHIPDVQGPSTTFGAYLSTNLPNLKTVFLTLIPRNPTRINVRDWEWGQPIEDFLSCLGDSKATIILNLRWREDCDYFEGKHVGTRGWRCIRRSENPDEHAQVLF